MNKVYVVGLGPGREEFLSSQARAALEKAQVLCGYTVYVDLIRDLFPDKEVYTTPMRQERERCRWALETASEGKTVAMVCSGDAGVYGMAGLVLQLGEEYPDTEIEVVPGITAALSGAAVLGAPLGHDFCVISLSNLLTPWAVIERRIRCGVQGDVLEKQRPSGVLYEFNIREPEQVARMHELFGTTGSETSLQIDPALIRCQTCVSAYIGAAFLCSGTVTDPQKEYNLEFLTARTNLARDFEALLAEHEFAPHRTRRNGVNLVYVKNSANLERLLRFMGAAGAAEEIHAQKAFKQVRNQTNRQTNCDTANLGKTARANAQTLRAIRYLQENDALETLPEVLQQAAAVRLQYPDLSLTALCGCFDPAVSKSGLSHRMKKLEALADALRQRVEKGQEAEP